MQLNSSDRTSVGPRVAGYEFPDYDASAPNGGLRGPGVPGNVPVVADTKWDPNWLQLSGRVTLPGGKSWAFREPCLDIWEARELGDWLRGVAAGTEPPFRGIREPGGGWFSPSPNLSFRLEERTVGRVRIRVEFTGEVTPPWFGGGPVRAPNSYLVDLDASAEEMAQAAESWVHDLAEFPER